MRTFEYNMISASKRKADPYKNDPTKQDERDNDPTRIRPAKEKESPDPTQPEEPGKLPAPGSENDTEEKPKRVAGFMRDLKQD